MVYSSIEVVVSFQVLIYGIWYSFHSFIIPVLCMVVVIVDMVAMFHIILY